MTMFFPEKQVVLFLHSCCRNDDDLKTVGNKIKKKIKINVGFCKIVHYQHVW